MTRLSNPARARLTPAARTGQADGSDPLSAPVRRILAPEDAPFSLDALLEDWRTYAARADRRAAQASMILILIALLIFGTALPGAPRPGEFVGRPASGTNLP